MTECGIERFDSQSRRGWYFGVGPSNFQRPVFHVRWDCHSHDFYFEGIATVPLLTFHGNGPNFATASGIDGFWRAIKGCDGMYEELLLFDLAPSTAVSLKLSGLWEYGRLEWL